MVIISQDRIGPKTRPGRITRGFPLYYLDRASGTRLSIPGVLYHIGVEGDASPIAARAGAATVAGMENAAVV
jgi:hypothetical protein